MIAKSVALLLDDLGVIKTHGRPHVSNDNLCSESPFKTLRYRPEFSSRVSCLQNVRSFLLDFFQWYNTPYHHSCLGWLTPWDLYRGHLPSGPFAGWNLPPVMPPRSISRPSALLWQPVLTSEQQMQLRIIARRISKYEVAGG